MSENRTAADTPAKPANPLHVRNFRLLWIGESISLLGDQFYLIALPWLVLQLTGDALALGTVLALASIPRALFMLVGGALVDRFSPRSVMYGSNLVRMLVVAVFSLLVITDAVQLWMLYVLALIFGTADAFFFPAQSAIVPQILDDEQLQAGNTLTQGMGMLSMFVGPVLAGILIAALGGKAADGAETPGMQGIGIAFGLDALSFLASMMTLWMMRIRKPHEISAEQASVLSAIKEGIDFVWKNGALRMLFILLIGLNLFVLGPFNVGVPVLAERNLAEGAAAFGLVMSAYGGGALVGIILSGVLPRPKPSAFGAVLLGAIALIGIGMILLPFGTSTPVVALICLVMGTAMGYVNIQFITWIQKRIPDQLMGRVMSFLMFASYGVAPISSALAGAILNVQFVLLFVGAGVLMTGITLLAAQVSGLRHMGLEVEEIEKKPTIAAALRTTGEYSVIRSTQSTGTMPVVRL